jgi:hypothetical protein
MEHIKGSVYVNDSGPLRRKLALTELHQPPAGGKEARHTCASTPNTQRQRSNRSERTRQNIETARRDQGDSRAASLAGLRHVNEVQLARAVSRDNLSIA